MPLSFQLCSKSLHDLTSWPTPSNCFESKNSSGARLLPFKLTPSNFGYISVLNHRMFTGICVFLLGIRLFHLTSRSKLSPWRKVGWLALFNNRWVKKNEPHGFSCTSYVSSTCSVSGWASVSSDEDEDFLWLSSANSIQNCLHLVLRFELTYMIL